MYSAFNTTFLQVTGGRNFCRSLPLQHFIFTDEYGFKHPAFKRWWEVM